MIKSRVKKLILPTALMLLFVCPFIGLLLANADEVMSGGGYAVTGQLSETGYTSVVYDANNGLPTSDANYIYSADDGFMWIGGYSGIFRYDGSVFERLDATDGLTSGRVIFEDSSNRIWVGTNDNGVVMLDNGVSTHITYNEGLPSSSIRAFAEDNDGNIIVGSTAGISYIDKDNIVHTIDNEELNTKRIVRLGTDANGRVFGLTREGQVFSIDDLKVTSIYVGSDLGIEEITALYVDENDSDKVYLGTNTSNLYYGSYGDSKEDLQKILVAPLDKTQWICNSCGRIWVTSTTQTGYIDERSHFRLVSDIPFDSSIEMMTSDYQGNMWYASTTQGVMKIVANSFVDVSAKAGLDEEVVNTTCVRDDILYIGTDNGVRIVDSNNNIIKNKLTAYIGGARIRSIIKDDQDNIYVSTFTDDLGLICYDKDENIKAYTEDQGMPSNEVRCAVQASDGSILVGTNGGLAVIKDGSVVRTVGEAEGVKNPVFLTVCEGDDGIIYAGSDGDGIYVIDGTDVKKLSRDDGLTSDVIMRIKKDDARNVYWIITSNSIEYMRDNVVKNVTSFPYNNNFDVFLSDDNIWILSSYGVFSVSGNEMISDNISNYRLFTVSNGLSCTPTSNSYSYMDESGNIYISGRSGVNLVNINKIHDAALNTYVNISSVSFNGEEVLPDKDDKYLIPSGEGRIKITPAVLDYSMSDPVIHAYLEGAGDDGVTERRSNLSSLEYTDLKYGEYTLHIQILDNSGETVLQEKKFTIEKQPKFFELLAVKLITILLAALILVVVVWRVLNSTVIRKQYFEIQAAKNEAERANKAKSHFLTNISNELRTPIGTIMGMNEMILRENHEDVPKPYLMSITNYAMDIKNASQSLLLQINDIFEFSSVESGKAHLEEQEYDLHESLESIIKTTRDKSYNKNIDFYVGIDETIPTRLYGDIRKIRQIILKLLSNSVKYTDDGIVTLSILAKDITDEKCTLIFSVSDTGIGVDTGKEDNALETGLGLEISKKYAKLLGSKLETISDEDMGTEFRFEITQGVIDGTERGEYIYDENDNLGAPYIPQFIAPDADVLIADSNPMNLLVLRGLLKATKVVVTAVSHKEQFLERIKYGKYDFILFDYDMPGTEEIDIPAKIKEKMPKSAVYALSADSSLGEDFFIQKGYSGLLFKPVNSLALEKAIMKHLPSEMMMKPFEEAKKNDLKELPDDKKWINNVEGLSVSEGVLASQGMNTFIENIVNFRDTIDANAEVIENAYKEDNMELLTVKIRSLRTSARLVGAGDLAALAAGLEAAGRRRDKVYFDEHLSELIEMYKAFKEKLKENDDESESDE